MAAGEATADWLTATAVPAASADAADAARMIVLVLALGLELIRMPAPSGK
jgi:hypothetical protein